MKFLHVPYRGAAPALTDFLGGQVTALPADLPVLISQIKGGNLVAIGRHRTSATPSCPMCRRSPNRAIRIQMPRTGMAPRTGQDAAAVIAKINSAVNDALNDPATHDKLVQSGATPVGGTPESFGKFLKAEYDKWGRVVKERGIKE